MILWKDFILDDVVGAVLSPEIFAGDEQVRRNRVAAKSSVMDGVKKALNQETRQESEPATSNTGCVRSSTALNGQSRTGVRDSGRTDLDYSNATTRMDSGGFGSAQLRQRGMG